MKGKTKRKFERVVMILLVVVFLLGWTLLLYLPTNNAGTQTAPVNSGPVQTAAPGP